MYMANARMPSTASSRRQTWQENWRENHGHLVTFAVHISGKRDASSL